MADIAFVSEVTGQIASGSGSSSVSIPSGLQENDIVIAFIVSDATLSFEGILGQGWTLISNEGSASPGVDIKYKRMAATPDTTVNIEKHFITRCGYIMQAWRNVNTDTAFDTAFTLATGDSSTPNSPSITTVNDNSLVISLGCLDDDDRTGITFPSGYTDTAEENTGGGGIVGGTVGVASKIISTASAENPGAFNFGSSDQWRAYSLALRPAATSKIQGATSITGVQSITI